MQVTKANAKADVVIEKPLRKSSGKSGAKVVTKEKSKGIANTKTAKGIVEKAKNVLIHSKKNRTQKGGDDLEIPKNLRTPEAIINFLKEKNENNDVTSLRIRGSDLYNEVAEYLKKMQKLEKLHVTVERHLFKDEKVALMKALPSLTKLTDLDLSRNCLDEYRDDHNISNLAEVLKVMPKLTVLKLGENYIDRNGALALSESIQFIGDKSCFKQLDLSSNEIGNNGAKHIADAFPYMKKLTKLDLSSNEIGDNGAAHIAAGFPYMKKLTTLRLSSNKIGDNGAKHIAGAFLYMRQLTTLDLSSNKIGDNGAKHIAAGIMIQPRIMIMNDTLHTNETIINFSMDPRVTIGVRNLTVLDLNNNKIGEKGAIILAKALPFVKKLTELNLSENAIRDTGVTALANALPSLTKLTTLDIMNNEIGNTGAEALAEALAKALAKEALPNLRWIAIDDNPIEKDKAAVAYKALENRYSLSDKRINNLLDTEE